MRTTSLILLAALASAVAQESHTQQLRGDRFLSVSTKATKETSAKSSKTADAKAKKMSSAKAEKEASLPKAEKETKTAKKKKSSGSVSAKATKVFSEDSAKAAKAESSSAKAAKAKDTKADKASSVKSKSAKTKSEKMSASAKAAKAVGSSMSVDPNPPTPIIIGTTAYYLNGILEVVRTRETNLGQLVADSYIWFIDGYLKASGSADNNLPERADIALKNAGAIRSSIDGPDVTISDIEAALSFNNKLSVIRVTVPQLLAAMENAVSSYPRVLGAGGPGHFPQITGMEITFDPTKLGVNGKEEVTEPSRVTSMKVGEDVIVENGQVVDTTLTNSYVMATTDYLSEGGSEFVSLAAGEKLGDTGTGEQYALADYIQSALNGKVDIVDPPLNQRVQCVGVECVSYEIWKSN